MLISASSIRNLANDGIKLTSSLSGRQLNFIEGSAINLKIGRLCVLKRQRNPPIIGVHGTAGTEVEDVELYSDAPDSWMLLPHEYYLAQTVESVSVPSFAHAFIESRSRCLRYGVKVYSGGVHPGFNGQLTVGVEVVRPTIIEKGAEFIHLVFAEFDSPQTDAYKGIWGGGRITNPEMERPK